VFETVLRLVKSCVFRPLDRRQASGHTLRCVRYEPTVIYNLVQPPGIHPVHTIPNNYTMAGKRTVDIRLAFEQYDMIPGPAGKKFQRNLLLNGGSADTQGFSITDCFLRLDDYAVQNGQPTTMPPPAGVLAAPGAGVPPVPAGNAGQIAAALSAQHAARKARLKQSFTFLTSHISDSSTLELLGDPLSPTLASVSHGFQDAVLEHVDMVYAAEDRARKGDFDWPADSSDSESTEEIDTAAPRPRNLMPAAVALSAVALACIAMWFSAARLILVKLGEALSGATIALPAGILTVLIVLLLSARAGAVGLPYDQAAIAHGRTFDHVERCTPLVERAYDTADGPASVGIYRMCWDSGCTCYCIPSEDRWMLDHVTDSQPNIGVEVASDAVLVVEAVGLINSTHPPKLVCDSFKIENGVKIATVSAPTMSRVLVTRGLKKTTRLGGVRPARLLDGTFAYFNDDNTAGIADCVRFADGAYTLFDGTRHEIVFRQPTPLDLQTYLRPEMANVGRSSRTPSPVEVHCSLGHCSDRRISASLIVMDGVDLRSFHFDAALCRGCRLGKTQEANTRITTAPSRGPPLSRNGTVPRPSTSGYNRFGHRIDSDICTSMPRSWPHGFTAMMNFCDRYSAEFFLSFLLLGEMRASAWGVTRPWLVRSEGRPSGGTPRACRT